jgi:tetratricopeptide (TPR) repeat protein
LKTNLDFICDFRGKFEHIMSMKEIEKLREKVEKDPNSKLYVPLAEEYRKEGMLDEAVEVLQKGIERQPGYMSARVSLGKIYLEKGHMDEARAEFEQVVKVIPDNLYSHKKLAEIYRDTGERDLAIRAFRTFLKLNPMDAEALNSLRDLEGMYTEQSPAKPKETGVSVVKEAEVNEGPDSEAMSLEQTFHEQIPSGPTESGEELNAFKESLFGVNSGSDAETPDKLFDEEEIAVVEEIPEEADKEWSFVETGSTPEIDSFDEDIAVVEEIPEEADKEWSFVETGSTPEVGAFDEDAVTGEELSEDADGVWSFGDISETLKPERDETKEEVEEAPDDLFRAENVPDASGLRSQGNNEILQTADTRLSACPYR